jgi:hypothetical protein
MAERNGSSRPAICGPEYSIAPSAVFSRPIPLRYGSPLSLGNDSHSVAGAVLMGVNSISRNAAEGGRLWGDLFNPLPEPTPGSRSKLGETAFPVV